MQLSSDQVFEFFLEKRVTHLHHANTVTTSCAFIQRKALFARGCMDYFNFNQTAQKSDETDRLQGVYFDVFLDTVDIHTRAKARNDYGPVLFELSAKKLIEMKLPPLWITKSNPINWTEKTTHQEKWFQNVDELRKDFVVGRFNQMIVLRHIGGILSLESCLDRVVVDDPQMNTASHDTFTLSLGALVAARASAITPMSFKFKKRACSEGCKCLGEYQAKPKITEEFFVPHRTKPAPSVPAIAAPWN